MGILEDAGIEPTDVPNDPYGFGRDYWPVQIIGVKAPDVSSSGKQYGTMLKWKCLAEQYSYMESLGGGNWLQLPPPAHVLETIPTMEWDKSGMRGKQCIFNITRLYQGLGIPADQWAKINAEDLLNMRCMAKIFVKQNDEGFWQFNVTGHKPMPPEGSVAEMGMGVFAPNGSASANPSSSAGLSAMERAMQNEIDGS